MSTAQFLWAHILPKLYLNAQANFQYLMAFHFDMEKNVAYNFLSKIWPNRYSDIYAVPQTCSHNYVDMVGMELMDILPFNNTASIVCGI